jgi:hypothetical protein
VWASALALRAAVGLLGDQASVPAQDGVGCDDRAQILEHLPAEGLAADRQPATLVVVEEDPLAAELLSEDAVLLAEILDGLLLLLAEPVGE